jgi:hypothetical protein
MSGVIGFPVEDSPRVQQLRLLREKLAGQPGWLRKSAAYGLRSWFSATPLGSAGYFDSSADIDHDSGRNVVLGDPPKKTAKDDERLIHVFVDQYVFRVAIFLTCLMDH